MRPIVHRQLRRLAGRGACAALLALAAGLAAAPAGANPPEIAAKRAEAQLVLTQVQELDSRVEKAVEAYNLATLQLDRIAHDLKANTYDLGVARSNFRRAQKTLAGRLVFLYTSAERGSAIEVILGAKSMSDLIERIDATGRVSEQDGRVAAQVTRFRAVVAERQAALSRARARQRRIVAERAATQASIERQLAERQRLLSSIRSEVVRLEAEERARQERLRREAEARLRAQQAEARRVAAYRRELARKAEQAGEPAPPAPPTRLGLAATTPEGVSVAPPARYTGVVAIAMQYLGVPYVWGGASPAGFDCSGFVMYVYAKVGVSLPHYAAAQYGYGSPVSKDQLEPGDLVFFDGLGHNGIYIGGGQFIHAPHSGDVVKISSLSDGWYTSKWVGARRL